MIALYLFQYNEEFNREDEKVLIEYCEKYALFLGV